MSIASEITRIKGNISDSYTEAEAKGATMPDTLNSDNLAECIASIPTSPTPPTPTGDIAVIIYTYDNTMGVASYVDSVYTSASKGDTITLPAIADVAEANIGTADYNPALTADGWSGDVEVVNGQFTIPTDWKLPEIVFNACYYTTNGEMCYVFTDNSHRSTVPSESLQFFCTNIFCSQSASNVLIGRNDRCVRSLVGPNRKFFGYNMSEWAYGGSFRLVALDVNRSTYGNTLQAVFHNFLDCKHIIGHQKMDLQNVNNLRSSFYQCASLQSLDLSGCNLSAVTNLQQAWYACYSMQSFDLSGCNLSAVTNLQQAWYACYSMQSLDLSGCNLSAVTNLQQAWNGCYSMQSLNVANANLSHVTTQTGLTATFANCLNLLYITLADTDQETGFFNFASGLTIDFSTCTHLGIDLDGNDNGWRAHLLACTPQQATGTTKGIKLSANTYNLFSADDISALNAKGYTISK